MTAQFKQVKHFGRNSYFCEECPFVNGGLKSTSTPHCMKCGKHHPIHKNCDGSDIMEFDVKYLQLFYSNPHPHHSIGIV